MTFNTPSIHTFSPVTTQFKSQSHSVTLPLESGQKQIVCVFFLEQSFSWFCSSEVRTPGFFLLELCENGFQQILVVELTTNVSRLSLMKFQTSWAAKSIKSLNMLLSSFSVFRIPITSLLFLLPQQCSSCALSDNHQT